MSKKIFSMLIVLLVFVSLASVFAVETTTHDFDGLFNMNVPSNEDFVTIDSNITGASVFGYNFNDEDPIGDNIIVYYFNDSIVDDNDTNITEYVINTLDENSTFKHPYVEDGFIILSNQAIQHDGAYMLITSNGNDTEVVGVVGDNLDDLKTYAESIAFV